MLAFKIEQLEIISAKIAVFISQPSFFLNEEKKTYRATVKCYDSNKEFIENKEVAFTQEEYDTWGTENEYIYKLIHEKLGTTRTSAELTEI